MDINSKGILTTPSDISEVGPADGLVAWYPLNGNTYDYAQSNDGVNNGAIATARGYEFDGASAIQTDFSFDKNDFTYSAWVYIANAGTGYKDVVDSYEGTSAEWTRFGLLNGNWVFLLDNNSVRYDLVGSTPNLNTWYHGVAVRKNNVANIYINGTLDTSGTPTESGVIQGLGFECIGARSGSTAEGLEGSIADVRIYNRALSDQEIAVLYEMTDPTLNTRMKQTKDTLYVRGQFQEI